MAITASNRLPWQTASDPFDGVDARKSPDESGVMRCAAVVVTNEDVKQYSFIVDQEVSRALRRIPSSVQREELESAARLGLLHALRNTNERDEGFVAYVRIRVRGAILDELRDHDWFPRSQRMAARRDGRTLSVILLADGRGERIAAHAPTSDPFRGERDAVSLRQLIDRLPERERAIILAHYEEDVSLTALAHRYEVSAARISQIHAAALRRLHTLLLDDAEPAPSSFTRPTNA
jgi:RNA polymerase sigma factor for flagellar operon FliA